MPGEKPPCSDMAAGEKTAAGVIPVGKVGSNGQLLKSQQIELIQRDKAGMKERNKKR